jgi:hypothetical protein
VSGNTSPGLDLAEFAANFFSGGPLVKTIYSSDWLNLRPLGIVENGSHAGWLAWKHPDGNWVTLADLKPHFPPPPLTPEQAEPAKVCAQLARRVAELELELAALKAHGQQGEK